MTKTNDSHDQLRPTGIGLPRLSYILWGRRGHDLLIRRLNYSDDVAIMSLVTARQQHFGTCLPTRLSDFYAVYFLRHDRSPNQLSIFRDEKVPGLNRAW